MLFSFWAQAAPPKALDRVLISGTAYCSMKQWADSIGMAMSWNKKTGDIVLTKKNMRLDFTVNSRRCHVNGDNILLSLPIAVKGKESYIPVVELQTTFHPILFPVKTPATKPIQVICIDPGHGGKDTGKVDGSNYEKKYTLLLAQEVAAQLQPFNVKVVMTRTKDETLELSDRPDIARRKKADLFVSLHYNAASPDINGVEVYCLSPAGMASSNEGGGRANKMACPGNSLNSENMLLAHLVHRQILRGTGIVDRGLKRSRFAVLRTARMPAILIECGFMTNKGDARKIADPAFRKKMAQSIVNGIIAYKRTVERP
jgi:N-acetylmuramoyl-L-alanine amidase